MRWNVRSPFPLLLLVLTASGCASYYRAETVLHPDGSVDRAIYQPRSSDEHFVKALAAFAGHRSVRETNDDNWSGGIRDQLEEKDTQYIAAWGHFRNPRKIPAHIRFAVSDAEPSGPAGELVRAYDRRDLGFVIEHVWTETLTDVVTLPDAQQACDELLARVSDDLGALLAAGLGDAYDYAPLLAWIDSDGRRWLREAVLVLYDVSARETTSADRGRRLVEELVTVSAPYGLDLRDESGAPQAAVLRGDADVVGRAFRLFVEQKLRVLIRRKDGEPVEDSVWTELNTLVERLLAGGDQAENEADSATVERWRELAHAMILNRYKTEENYNRLHQALLARIVGVHQMPLFGPRSFAYKLTVPGVIVETSGRLLNDNEVLFAFLAQDAFPIGKRMTCRSLYAEAEVQQRVLGSVPLKQRASISEYAELVQRDEILRDVLIQCVRRGSLAELDQYRLRLQAASDKAGLERLLRIRALLGLSADED